MQMCKLLELARWDEEQTRTTCKKWAKFSTCSFVFTKGYQEWPMFSKCSIVFTQGIARVGRNIQCAITKCAQQQRIATLE